MFDGLFSLREFENNLKTTLGWFFFINIVLESQKRIKVYKGELF